MYLSKTCYVMCSTVLLFTPWYRNHKVLRSLQQWISIKLPCTPKASCLGKKEEKSLYFGTKNAALLKLFCLK